MSGGAPHRYPGMQGMQPGLQGMQMQPGMQGMQGLRPGMQQLPTIQPMQFGLVPPGMMLPRAPGAPQFLPALPPPVRHVVQPPIPLMRAVQRPVLGTAPPLKAPAVRPPPIRIPTTTAAFPAAPAAVAGVATDKAAAAAATTTEAAQPEQAPVVQQPPPEPAAELEPSNISPIAHSLCFHPEYPDKPYVVTGDSDGVLCMMHAEAGRSCRMQIGISDAPVLCCASDSTTLFVAVGGEVIAILWTAVIAAVEEPRQVATKQAVDVQCKYRTVHTVPQGEIAVSLAVAGDMLYVGDSCGQLCAYSTVDGSQAGGQSGRLHYGNITAIVAVGGGRLATASDDGTVCFSSLTADQPVKHFVPCVLSASGEQPERRGQKRAADGTEVSSDEDRDVFVFSVNAMDVDADGFWLAVGGDVPYVSLLNLLTQKVQKILPLPSPEMRVRSVRFRDSAVLVGCDDGSVLVYSLSGQLLDTKSPACESAHALAVAGNGHWAVTGKNTCVEIFAEH